MHITIEDNKVIVNLDEFEFPKFQAMFANLEDRKSVECEFREFNSLSGTTDINLLPMHLCRSARTDSHLLPKTGRGGFRNIVSSLRKEPLFIAI